MPRMYSLENKKRTQMVFPVKDDETCRCCKVNLPPWTGELHGLSQALLSKSFKMKVFWWFVMIVCITCGSITTIMIVVEYLEGPTATSTTIQLVSSLELPSITVCPKVPDAFNALGLLADIKHAIPKLSNDECLDLVRFWIGGYGLENMDVLPDFNSSYLNELNEYFQIWSKGYTVDEFFKIMQDKYGYRCNELFYECELGGVTYDCCNDLFDRKMVMRRGICYTTRRGVNQTEADDMGRLILRLKAPTSITTPRSNYVQDQIIIYITDSYDKIPDFPRFYLYPYNFNRMRFTARLLELLEQPGVCTHAMTGRDAECIVRKWLLSNIVYPHNCTLTYLNISKIPTSKPCEPLTLATNYYNAVQLVWASLAVKETCVPGCRRWDNQITLQQTKTLHSFEGHVFNLELSFSDLQYEYVKEVYTISVPGFMSQIGGQFGFFLGLSIITFIQMTLYALHYCITLFYKKTHRYITTTISGMRSRADSIHPRNSFAVTTTLPKTKADNDQKHSTDAECRQPVVQISGRLIDHEENETAINTCRRKTVATNQKEDDHNNYCNSIYKIDAVSLLAVAGSQNTAGDDNDSKYRKYSLKRLKRNDRLRKGDVTFAYRTRPPWLNGVLRTVSDEYPTRGSKHLASETSFGTVPRTYLMENNVVVERNDDAKISKRNPVEILETTSISEND